MDEREPLTPDRKPLEPDAVYTAEEWADRELTQWMSMTPGPERTRLKQRAFYRIYGGGPEKLRDYPDVES